MIEISVEPLTAQAFADFGSVVKMAGHEPLIINEGYAQRFHDLSIIDVGAEGGKVCVSIFQARARPQPIVIDMMERHPLGSQLFYPLQRTPWLVVVAHDPLQPSSFRCFGAQGDEGVNYAKNCWHFPLLVLGDEQRFLVIDRQGPGSNLEVVTLPQALQLKSP